MSPVTKRLRKAERRASRARGATSAADHQGAGLQRQVSAAAQTDLTQVVDVAGTAPPVTYVPEVGPYHFVVAPSDTERLISLSDLGLAVAAYTAGRGMETEPRAPTDPAVRSYIAMHDLGPAVASVEALVAREMPYGTAVVPVLESDDGDNEWELVLEIQYPSYVEATALADMFDRVVRGFVVDVDSEARQRITLLPTPSDADCGA